MQDIKDPTRLENLHAFVFHVLQPTPPVACQPSWFSVSAT